MAAAKETTVTTGWERGKNARLAALPREEGRLSAQQVGTSTTVIGEQKGC
jgi:hypothetical protein